GDDVENLLSGLQPGGHMNFPALSRYSDGSACVIEPRAFSVGYPAFRWRGRGLPVILLFRGPLAGLIVKQTVGETVLDVLQFHAYRPRAVRGRLGELVNNVSSA